MSLLLLPFAVFLVMSRCCGVSHLVTTAFRNLIFLELFVGAGSTSDKLSSGGVSEFLFWL